MKMTDLTLTPEEAKEMVAAERTPCGEGEPPKYPYGTAMYFPDDLLKKLGINELPAVGAKMLLTAEVFVSGVSQRENQSENSKSVDLQMTAVSLEPKVEAAATRMYPNSLMTQ